MYCDYDKLHGSVAACFRCGGLFSCHLAMYLLLSLVLQKFQNRWTRGKVKGKKVDCLVCLFALQWSCL